MRQMQQANSCYLYVVKKIAAVTPAIKRVVGQQVFSCFLRGKAAHTTNYKPKRDYMKKARDPPEKGQQERYREPKKE